VYPPVLFLVGHPSKSGPRAALSRSMQQPNSVFSHESHSQIWKEHTEIDYQTLLNKKNQSGSTNCTHFFRAFETPLILGPLLEGEVVGTASERPGRAKLVVVTAVTV
jgi:hypothetical protein